MGSDISLPSADSVTSAGKQFVDFAKDVKDYVQDVKCVYQAAGDNIGRILPQSSGDIRYAFGSSLQNYIPNDNIQDDKLKKNIRVIDITTDLFAGNRSVECGDLLEFDINGSAEYDIFQVSKDGDDYYPVDHGYGLMNIKSSTPKNDRRILLSLVLDEDVSETYLYFCVIPSFQCRRALKTGKCPPANCESNYLIIRRRVQQIPLTDAENNQKVYLRKGDSIELKWPSKHGTTYHIEEKKYCPKSGGLYTPEPTRHREVSQTAYKNTFHEFGMLFLFRLTNTNQIHDITVCIINDKHRVKHIKITDNNISPNTIWIEEKDWIMFECDTKHELTIVKIKPSDTDENQQQSTELGNVDEPTHRGYRCRRFDEAGVYCYKIENDPIGTIIVKPQETIHQVPLFSDQLIHKMNTNDSVQFNWRMRDSKEEPVLITFDSKSSEVSDAADGRTGIFDCSKHKCRKIEPFFRHYFHSCETFVFNVPQHGLYNFAYSNNPDNALISLIVEKGVDTHHVNYVEENTFEPRTIKINCLDQILFKSSSVTRAGIIYQTDEYGNRLGSDQILFEPQRHSIYYFMKKFSQSGVYYFSTGIKNHGKQKRKQSSRCSLAIVVLPEIRFHEKLVGKGNFDSQTIITANINDFIIWQFEKTVSHNVIRLRSNETFQGLISCHDRAVIGKNRRCLAVNCKHIPPGISFFCNPDFERVTGSYQDRLISPVIVDPPFSQNSFIVTNDEFVPNILHIAQNDTVSWVLGNNVPNHRIYVKSDESDDVDDENIFIDQNIAQYVDGVCHLHTFNEPGEYIIKSDLCPKEAIVVVYPDSEKSAQKPKIIEEIDPVSEFDTQIHFDYPNRGSAKIYYTLNGLIPTRRDDNVHLYDPNNGVHFRQPGLRLLRAYSTEHHKLPSSITNSRPTFVIGGNEESESSWTSCRITLSASLRSLRDRNTIYGKIDIEPARFIDIIDHFQLYINDRKSIVIGSTDSHFSVDDFGDDEHCEIYVVAHPKDHIPDAEPILSEKLTLKPKRGQSDDRRENSSKDRARILLELLRQAIINRSQESYSTTTHPHPSFPGVPHYIDNQRSPQGSISTNGRDVVITGRRGVRSPRRSEQSRFVPVETAFYTDRNDY